MALKPLFKVKSKSRREFLRKLENLTDPNLFDKIDAELKVSQGNSDLAQDNSKALLLKSQP